MANLVPVLVTNPVINSIIVTIVPAALYTAAAFGHIFLKQLTIGIAILISIFFAALEYIVRIPIIKYSSEIAGMSDFSIQTVWVVLTLIMAGTTDLIRKRVEKNIPIKT
jgi:uncharacterized protein (DUF486 family)